MKRSKKALARVLSLAMAAVMAFGLSMTAFAAGPDDANIGTGATGNAGVGGYPAGMNRENMAGTTTTQFVDRGWKESDAAGTAADTEAATLTVSGIVKTSKNDEGKNVESPANDGDFEVNAYRIVEAVYDPGTGGFLRWADVADSTVDFVDDKGNVIDGAFNRANIGKVGSAAAAGDLGEGIKMTLANGVATVNTAPGSYVILVRNLKTNDEAATYGPMVVSAFYYDKGNGVTGMKNPTLGLVANQAFAKKQQAPTVDKQIADAYAINGNSVSVNTDRAVADAGDYVWFDILVKSIPEYHGAHPVFKVTDTISENLKADLGSVQVVAFFGEIGNSHTSTEDDRWIGKGAGVDLGFKTVASDKSPIHKLEGDYRPSVEQNGNAITFDFAPDSNYKLNDYAGFDMIIRYRAEVNSTNANYIEGIATMPNEADLTYSRNSAIEGDIGKDEDDPPVYVYSTKAVVKKVGSDGNALGGAKFELYVKDKDGNYLPYDGASTATSPWKPEEPEEGHMFFTSVEAKDADPDNGIAEGDIIMTGLGVGEYYLKEVAAPDGYAVSDKEYKITVKAYNADGTVVVVNNSTKPTADLVKADYTPDSADNPSVLTIVNSKMTELPSTGGAGTALLVGLGIAGVLAGAAVMFGTRKKQED